MTVCKSSYVYEFVLDTFVFNQLD